MSHDSPSSSSPGMHAYLQQFLQWSASMNYSPATTKTRATNIERFITWCAQRDITKPQDVTKPVLERYRNHLFHHRKTDGKPLSFSTQHSQLAPLKAFFKWLNKENYILYNPAADFELPRVPKRLPKDILTPEEIDAMLAQTEVYGEKGIRDRAIIDTFYSTGIRRMELVNLKIQDVDLVRGTLMVFEGKSQQDRIVPIGERAVAWVREYLEKVRPKLVRGEDSGYLFLTDRGQPFIRNRMTDLMQKYKNAAGIDKRGACHILRHSMATHMHDNGAEIRFIQEILGHKNLTTTQIYTRVSIKKLQEVHRATHPAKLQT